MMQPLPTASLRTSETVSELAAALASAQGEFPIIEKTKTAKLKGAHLTTAEREREYKYADLAGVLKAAHPILSKHKLAVVQPTLIEAGMVFVRTRLMHASGQWIESEYPVCTINGDHQKMGAALTYAKRCSLCALIGIAADEDLDGADAAAPTALPSSSPQQPAVRSRRNIVTPNDGARNRPLPPIVSRPVPRTAAKPGNTNHGARSGGLSRSGRMNGPRGRHPEGPPR